MTNAIGQNRAPVRLEDIQDYSSIKDNEINSLDNSDTKAKVLSEEKGQQLDKINTEQPTDFSKPVLNGENVKDMTWDSFMAELKAAAGETGTHLIKAATDYIADYIKAKITGEAPAISAGQFNFLSDDMMKIINIIMKYLLSMIKKYENSREISNMLMNINLDAAEKQKENLKASAQTRLEGVIAGSSLHIAGAIGGSMISLKGTKGTSHPEGSAEAIADATKNHRHSLTGEMVSKIAQPAGGIVQTATEMPAATLDGENKVLEANAQATNQVGNNNSESQRSAEDFTKMLLQALETINKATQETNATIAGNLRG